MKQHHRLLILTTLILIGAAVQVVLSQPIVPRPSETCPAIVETALTDIETYCDSMGRNRICYGYDRVDTEYIDVNTDPTLFDAAGERINIAEVKSLITSPYDPQQNEWGMALMRAQANIPGTLPGQGVVFLLMGDAVIENAVDDADVFAPDYVLPAQTQRDTLLYARPDTASDVIYSVPNGADITLDAFAPGEQWVRATYQDMGAADVALRDGQFGWLPAADLVTAPLSGALPVLDDQPHTPMQAFYFESGVGASPCNEAPNALIVQGPENVVVDLNVNGMDVRLTSGAMLRTLPNNELEITCLSEQCTLNPEAPNEQVLEKLDQSVCDQLDNLDLGTDPNLPNDAVEVCGETQRVGLDELPVFIISEEFNEDVFNYEFDLLGGQTFPTDTPEPSPTPTRFSGGIVVPTVTPSPMPPTPTYTPVPPTSAPASSSAAPAAPAAVAPIANPDSFTMSGGSVQTFNLLANDTGVPAPSAVSFGGPTSGNVGDNPADGVTIYYDSINEVTLDSAGNATVTTSGGSGAISFYYQIQNALGTDDAYVTITYGDAPTAANDNVNGDASSLSISDGAPGLLFNDTLGSPAASIVSFGGGSLGGSVTDNGAGSTALAVPIGASATLTINADGSYTLGGGPFNEGTFTVDYKIDNFLGDDTGTLTFTLDNSPFVQSTTPTNGATGVSNTANITVAFNESVNVTPVLWFSMSCTTSGTINNSNSTLIGNGTAGVSIDPDNPLSNGETCTATVVLSEVADVDTIDPPNVGAGTYVFSFTVVPGDLNPQISTFDPPNGSFNVPINKVITLTFSENVTIQPGAISLVCGSPIGFVSVPDISSVAASGVSSITLTPITAMPTSNLCTLGVTSADVTDEDGGNDPLVGTTSISFNTGAGPAVMVMIPANGSTGIATNTTIQLGFSSAVTIDMASVSLSCSPSGVQTFTPNTTLVGVATTTITPDSPLPNGEVCTVTVPPGAFSPTPADSTFTGSFTVIP